MLSFLSGFAANPIGEVLRADINISFLSKERDSGPSGELSRRLRKSGFTHVIILSPTADGGEQRGLNEGEPSVERVGLYLIERDLERLLKGGKAATMGNHYLPIGADKGIPISHLEDAVFQLQLKGYMPVLVQAERYAYLQANYRNIKRLIDRGCLLHIDILSLAGTQGHAAKKLSDKLLHDSYASFIGTGIGTLEDHKKFTSLERSRKLSKLLQSASIRNRELI